MFKNCAFGLYFGILSVFYTIADTGAATPFSQYGMIQSAPNYSTNPFYDQNSYTVTSPRVVYAPGPALKPGDCIRAVTAIIQDICAKRLNCKNTTLSDIRPDAMIRLSTLPGYNYSGSCAGYIDTIYEEYIKKQLSTTNNFNIAFPNAPRLTQNGNTNTTNTKTDEYTERANELKALQAQTNTISNSVKSAIFPTTFNDLSFQQRNEILRQGYEPYKDAQVYVPINLEIKKRVSVSETTKHVSIDEECKPVYECIEEFDTAETNATDRLYQEYQTNQKITTATTNQLTAAISNAILSACSCTTDSDNKLREMLGVSCDDDFKQTAIQTAKQKTQEIVKAITGK